MDLFTAIETRASAAKLSDPSPSKEELEKILTAGVHAPDHGRLAPWRFTVLQGDARARLGDAMAARRALQMAEAPDFELAKERQKAFRAPTIIVASATPIDAGEKVPLLEQQIAVGAAVQNMLLTIHALGYGAMWKTGPAAYDDTIKQALAIPPIEIIIGFIYLGTVSSPGKPRTASIEGLVRWL